MKIIRLNELQFKNYSNMHNMQNLCQTIEYSHIEENRTKEKEFLGLIDENNNVCAAVTIIVKNLIMNNKMATIYNMPLIDYNNYSLLNIFFEELKKYLKKEGYIYITINPMYYQRVFDKNNNLLVDNTSITDNMLRIGFKKMGYQNKFSKYDIIINNNNTKDIYKNISRNTKRTIQENKKLGISLKKGTIDDINTFYDLIKKKTNNNINYYIDLMTSLNTNNVKMNIFFATLDPKTYLINKRKEYLIEKNKNEKVQENFLYNKESNKEKLLNKKIEADKKLEKLHQELIQAIDLERNYKNNIILGTCATIKHKKEVYFLIEGYNDNFRQFHSSKSLKWSIIKHYSLLGYNIFNLGEIYSDYKNKDNKYYGIYQYKIGFGGNIIEYPERMLLIIDKNKYLMYSQICNLKRKSITM